MNYETPYLRQSRPCKVSVAGSIIQPYGEPGHTWGFLWRTMTAAWLLQTYRPQSQTEDSLYHVYRELRSPKSIIPQKRSLDLEHPKALKEMTGT
jgi:hypothetical protein